MPSCVEQAGRCIAAQLTAGSAISLFWQQAELLQFLRTPRRAAGEFLRIVIGLESLQAFPVAFDNAQ